MLKEALAGVLTPEEMGGLTAAFDQIGQVIIVRIPGPLLHKKTIIGGALLEGVKAARSVFCQVSAIESDHRTRGLEVIAGPDDSTTEYRESGCRFVVDVREAFFSPRLSTERARIAELVRDGETVLNMFGGTGAFSIVMAKNTRCAVYNIDINEAAIDMCRRSIGLNRLAGTVIPVLGDAAEACDGRIPGADRTLMLLPERSDEFLADAAAATRDGGTIHYYSHIHADKKADARRLSEEHYMGVAPARSEVIKSRLVRAVGPRYYQTVVDVRISK